MLSMIVSAYLIGILDMNGRNIVRGGFVYDVVQGCVVGCHWYF